MYNIETIFYNNNRLSNCNNNSYSNNKVLFKKIFNKQNNKLINRFKIIYNKMTESIQNKIKV
jgi:hypothetical protein